MEKRLTNIVKTADWGTSSLTIELVKSAKLPKVGDKINTGDVEAIVTSTNKELNTISFLLTKTPSLQGEVDSYVVLANEALKTIAELFYSNDATNAPLFFREDSRAGWSELSESSKDFYREKALDIFKILEGRNLLRYGSLVVPRLLESDRIKE